MDWISCLGNLRMGGTLFCNGWDIVLWRVFIFCLKRRLMGGALFWNWWECVCGGVFVLLGTVVWWVGHCIVMDWISDSSNLLMGEALICTVWDLALWCLGRCLVMNWISVLNSPPNGWDIVLWWVGHCLVANLISVLNNLLIGGAMFCNGWGIVLVMIGWMGSCNGLGFLFINLLMGWALFCNGGGGGCWTFL